MKSTITETLASPTGRDSEREESSKEKVTFELGLEAHIGVSVEEPARLWEGSRGSLSLE